MTEFFDRRFKPTEYPDISRHFRVQAEAAARATDEMVEQALRDAAASANQDNFFSVEYEERPASAHTPWSDPDSSPWLDVMNASRVLNGQDPIIDARRPVDGVHQITRVES